MHCPDLAEKQVSVCLPDSPASQKARLESAQYNLLELATSLEAPLFCLRTCDLVGLLSFGQRAGKCLLLARLSRLAGQKLGQVCVVQRFASV